MADWSIIDRDYSCYDYYQYYQEKDQNAPAQCVQESYNCPSPTLTLLLSPPQPCCQTQQTQRENPREIRNKAEKQRRDKMNQSVRRLASIVPTVTRQGRKLNKTSVLRLAAHYLRSHQHVFGSSIDRGPEFSMKFTETLLKNFKGFLITITYKGIVVVVSKNVQEYLGYSELDLLGQNVFSIVHNDDHQLLRDQLYPRSCALTSKGELSIPKEIDAEKKIAEALANERRSFIIRFKKHSQQRSEAVQYVTCHVEGSLRKSDLAGARSEQVINVGRRVRSRGDNPFACGNDIVFIGMVRPHVETFITESSLESFKMEYRTRHSIDGEIIQCEQRIALVTGYMTHEVNGVNAMNFMHRDDVRWVIIALREMYDQHRLVGESCYRLMTKNGQFIYMRTLGRLDVDQTSNAVTSFVCTNTVVAEQEGEQLIKLMKKKFTLRANIAEDPREGEEIPEENEKVTLPVEDPTLLEKVILHLVTDLPSPKPDYGETLVPQGHGDSSSLHLAIIPPRKEKIHEAIAKSYSVIRSCCSTMAGEKRKENKKNPKPENIQQVLYGFANTEVNLPTVSQNYSWAETITTNRITVSIAGSSNAILPGHSSQNLNCSDVPRPSSSLVQLSNAQTINAPERNNPMVESLQQSSCFNLAYSQDPIPSTSGVKRKYQYEKVAKKAEKMKLKKKVKKHGLPKEIDEMLCLELINNTMPYDNLLEVSNVMEWVDEQWH
ncbi:unnamed protein product, partial [Brenthis ino]